MQVSARRSGAFDLYFLAMCYQRLGDRDKARGLLAQARTWHDRQRSLTRVHAEELRRFRREAERAVGLPSFGSE